MDSLDRWHDWLDGLRLRLGSYRALAERMELHENTVLAWNKRTLPSADHEGRLAEVSGEDLTRMRAMLDAARTASVVRSIHEQRERLARREEVRATDTTFRVGEETRGGSRRRRQARPAGTRSAPRVRKGRRTGLAGLIGSVSLLALAGTANAQNQSHQVQSNYAESWKASSVKWRRRAA